MSEDAAGDYAATCFRETIRPGEEPKRPHCRLMFSVRLGLGDPRGRSTGIRVVRRQSLGGRERDQDFILIPDPERAELERRENRRGGGKVRLSQDLRAAL